MATIYEITGELAALSSLIDELKKERENAAQNSDTDEQTALNEFLAQNEERFTDKAEAYAKYITSLNADCEAIDGEIKRLLARKKAKENLAERLLASLDFAMQRLNKKSVSTPLFKIAFVKKPARVEVLDIDMLPAEYLKLTKTPNKTLIKEHLKEGVVIDGAALITDEKALRIR